MPTAPLGDGGSSGRYGSSFSLQTAVWQHVHNVPDGSQLISVRHQPLGPVAYLFEPDDELSVLGMDLVGGNVIIHAAHVRWGRLYAVMSGPTVTEVCLHDDAEQAAEFRQRSAALDDAYQDVFRQGGLDLEPDSEQDAAGGDNGDDNE